MSTRYSDIANVAVEKKTNVREQTPVENKNRLELEFIRDKKCIPSTSNGFGFHGLSSLSTVVIYF